MQTIEIRNVGPLRHVEMELKQFNFFIGEQGSGKSTIAKIVSHCIWMEKEVLTNPDNYKDSVIDSYDFLRQLEVFHLMEGYFRMDSSVKYISSDVEITIDEWSVVIKKRNTDTQNYKRVKVLYIPAERSYAIKSYSQTQEDNNKSFARDFETARGYTKTVTLDDGTEFDRSFRLPGLNVDYRVSTTKDGKSIDKLYGPGFDIKLQNASSGMQSMTPAAVAINFYSSEYKFYYKDIEEKCLLTYQQDNRRSVRNYILELPITEDEKQSRIEALLKTHKTFFVIEEPEQNLYPTTQRDFLDFIVSCCSGERKHQALVTTHSPYLINQLNLLFAAHDKGKKIDGASLNFDDVNVYAVEEGTVKDLKVKNEGVHLVDTVRLSEDIDAIYDQYDQLQ